MLHINFLKYQPFRCDSCGCLQIYRVEDGDTVPVDPSTYGQFFGGDCYLVQYSYSTGARMRHIIYTWWVQPLSTWLCLHVRKTQCMQSALYLRICTL